MNIEQLKQNSELKILRGQCECTRAKLAAEGKGPIPAAPRIDQLSFAEAMAAYQAHFEALEKVRLSSGGGDNFDPQDCLRIAASYNARIGARSSTSSPPVSLETPRALLARYNALNGSERTAFLDANGPALMAAAEAVTDAEESAEDSRNVSACDSAEAALTAFTKAPRDRRAAQALVDAYAALSTAGQSRNDFYLAHEKALMAALRLVESLS